MLAKPGDTATGAKAPLGGSFDLANKPSGVAGLSNATTTPTSSAPASIALPSTSEAATKAAQQDAAVASAKVEQQKQVRATQASQEARVAADQKQSQTLTDLMANSVTIQTEMASTLKTIASKLDGIAKGGATQTTAEVRDINTAKPVNMAVPQKAAVSPINLKRSKRG